MLSLILSGQSLKTAWKKSKESGKCPATNVLDTVETCKLAGLMLGHDVFETTMRLQRPTGCYYDINFPEKVILNTAQTIDKNWDSTTEGEICGWKQGNFRCFYVIVNASYHISSVFH